jgi:hypothetical protein
MADAVIFLVGSAYFVAGSYSLGPNPLSSSLSNYSEETPLLAGEIRLLKS